ncbi:hypothetical protein P22_3902 [Propionispora sp. 2/2-37]|uniref:adenosylmethionine decarboxylase n=1 Tax=Propionispora sp. 2/2-37 TaxID=1677858 RepID=UPI0006BB9580|nr:adenosylmethionine decarboxylase [Propionispora sp. 2/2-37]CUH97758.1 hypothetical protein P22_3902 [Propionispora sp. 2/2-37]
MRKVLGRHLAVDLYDCSFENLDNMDFIKTAIYAAISESAMTPLEFSCHKFEPQGIAALMLLSEGHINLHTYPDLGYAAIDIFSCEDQARPNVMIKILKHYFRPGKIKTTTIKRGDFGSERDMRPRVKVSVAPLRRVRDTGARVLKFLSRPK